MPNTVPAAATGLPVSEPTMVLRACDVMTMARHLIEAAELAAQALEDGAPIQAVCKAARDKLEDAQELLNEYRGGATTDMDVRE